MPESSNQEIFDNEGHINYDKVVEIVHLNLKNFLNAIFEESFTQAKDGQFRSQINDISGKARDQSLDVFLERKHIVSSELYVELESRFYTPDAANIDSLNNNQINTQSMDTDSIELSLAINQLVDQSIERHSELIKKLSQQLEELSFIAHQEFNTHCLKPKYIYTLIQNCITPLNISTDGKILISKLLYQNISPNLNDFYLAMHRFLLDVDIHPIENPKNISQTQNKQTVAEKNPSNSSIMTMSTGQFFAPVEQEIWQQEYDANNDYVEKQLSCTPEIIDEVAMDVYGPGQTGLDDTTVSLLLQPYSPNTQSDSSPAQRRQFVRALSSVQRVEAANNAIFQTNQIKTAVRRTLQEKGALDAIEIVENEEKVIDFVCNIFQVILDDDSICSPIKEILARLQISTIKLSLIDFTFFQNAKHPARLLLNKLTSIGSSANGDEEPLFKELTSIIRIITDDFETDIRIFEKALLEINQLNIELLEQSAYKRQTELNKHKLRSQRSAAKRVVIHTIKKFTKRKEIPNQILEFCLKCWAPHMAYVYMNQGRDTKEWRNAVRTLRRIIEVSLAKHSLHEVHQYIHHPNAFFENIRIDLEYFTSRNEEFEEALEEAEVWYLTYLRKIEKEAKEIQIATTQEDIQTESVEEQDNVIHLFKNLSSTPNPNTINESLDDLKNIVAEEQEDNNDNKIADQSSNNEAGVDELTEDVPHDSNSGSLETDQDQEEAHEVGEHDVLISELDIEAEFDGSDIEEPELNIAEHLPDSIVPGVWLEVYQGEDKAKRRLKFSRANIETNHLIFSDRSGDYSFEIDLETFLDDLSTGKSILISESNRFDLALSSVISNIRSSHDDVDSK